MKLCTVSGSRAEFFILKKFDFKIQNNKNFKHHFIVAGSHTSQIFGNTIKDIKNNKVNISSIIKTNFKRRQTKPYCKLFRRWNKGIFK